MPRSCSSWSRGTRTPRSPRSSTSRRALPRSGFIAPCRHCAPDSPRAGAVRPAGEGTFALEADTVEGRAVWRVAQLWRVADTVRAETLVVDRASLSTLGRTVREAPYSRYREITVRQRVVGDGVVGWMQTERGLGRPIARRLPPAFGPYLSDALAPLALAGTPLSASWRGSLSVLGWAVRPQDVYYPAELRVVGAESVAVPAGTFDCWRLAVRVPGRAMSMWVRRSDGVAVRTRDETPRPGGRRRELVLVRS